MDEKKVKVEYGASKRDPSFPQKNQFYVLIFTLRSESAEYHRYIAIDPGLASECDIWHLD